MFMFIFGMSAIVTFVFRFWAYSFFPFNFNVQWLDETNENHRCCILCSIRGGIGFFTGRIPLIFGWFQMILMKSNEIFSHSFFLKMLSVFFLGFLSPLSVCPVELVASQIQSKPHWWRKSCSIWDNKNVDFRPSTRSHQNLYLFLFTPIGLRELAKLSVAISQKYLIKKKKCVTYYNAGLQ